MSVTSVAEDWKYTSLDALKKLTFKTVSSADHALERASLPFPELTQRLVFLNGYFQKSVSACLLPLSEMTEGISIRITTTMKDPLYLIYLTHSDEDYVKATYHNTILLEKGVNAKVIAYHLSLNDHTYSVQESTDIECHRNSTLDYIKIQNENDKTFHLATLQVTQHEASCFKAHHYQFGARLSRQDIAVQLQEKETACALKGFYFVNGSQHTDTHTRIDHLSPYSRSEEVYRGIAADRARAVYNGKIIVHPDAIKTDSMQSNKNLLLSSLAEIDTKPELEIYADDVKCAHGATVGALDESALFYLQSRGIDQDRARDLLIHAFAEEVVNDMPDELLRNHITAMVDAKLREVQHAK